MSVTRQGTNDAMTPESIQAMIDRAIQRNSTHTQDDASQSSGEGLRRPVQPARVCSYTDFMKCQPLNFKRNEGVVGLSQWLEKIESAFHISGCAVDNQGTLKKRLMDKYYLKGEIKKLEIELWNLRVKGNDVAAYTQRFQELALMCTKFLADETEKVNKYISGLPDNIHGNVMSARPKTLDETIELANDLMDQKLCTYAERQNESKSKVNDSPRNNQQQPHKKQNVAREYTAGPGEKKIYTGDLPLCTKCNYHHTGQCVPKCGKCKRYGHTTMDCRVNTNNNNNNKYQKDGACYECGNIGHIKKNCPKLKNRGNDSENDRKPMDFQVGDKVMLKVSPWKGVVRFGKRGKLNLRYIGPFQCLSDESLVILLEGLHVDDKLQFVEEPVDIIDREIKRLKKSRIPIIKVRWNFKRGPEFTWEREDQFKQ
nr:hypothetical protein [Tanacetum cinerariifolium]